LTRKNILEILVVFIYIDGLPLVISALETLSQANNEGTGCYDYWFKSFQTSLAGRGKMGSLVGASEDVKRAGAESSLNEYAVSIALCLISFFLLMILVAY
jgi:cytokinesis protein